MSSCKAHVSGKMIILSPSKETLLYLVRGKGLLMPIKETSGKLGSSRVSGFLTLKLLSQVSWSHSFPYKSPNYRRRSKVHNYSPLKLYKDLKVIRP